eukprot:Nk52_evm51s1810 gene=Nk52_evmTU51s1810
MTALVTLRSGGRRIPVQCIKRVDKWESARCGYAGLAFNKPNKSDTHTQTVRSTSEMPALSNNLNYHQSSSTGTGILSNVSEGIASIPGVSWFKKEQYKDPKFDVIASGLGSVLHVKLPANSKVLFKNGSAIAMSPGVKLSTFLNGGYLGFLFKYISGGSLFLQEGKTLQIKSKSEFSSGSMFSPKSYIASLGSAFRQRGEGSQGPAEPEQPPGQFGDILLSPSSIGDVVSIKMDGSSDYFLKRNVYLASSPGLSLNPAVDLSGLSTGSLLTMNVNGKGELAISSYGSIFRIVLDQNEKYIVASRSLIAWESSMNPQLIVDDIEETGNLALNVLKRSLKYIKSALSGTKKLCMLEGPGDFYVCSRNQPHWEGIKNILPGEMQLPKAEMPKMIKDKLHKSESPAKSNSESK